MLATRDRLLSDLPEGRGDLSAGNLTVTDERLKIVDCYVPQDRPPVSELVVTGPKSPSIGTLDDLAGKTVHVRMTSSYYESLVVSPAARQGFLPGKTHYLPPH